MRSIGRGFTARLRVGFTQMSNEAVATMVASMREGGSAVSFSLLQGEPQLLETLVESRQLDFALTHMPVGNPGLSVEVLAPMTMMLLCREGDDRWPAEGEIALDMLADVPLILLRRRSGVGIYERIVETFTAAGVACTIVAECTDVSAIYPLVQRNVGLGILPFHVTDVLRPGFSKYPVALGSAPERLALIHPRGRRVLPAVQRAMDLCRTILRTPQ
jgi:DNA-binding transcriptional LysR family regulator